MSATNHTTNYDLPIFVGTDKPAWLVDWNEAMTAIDTAIHQAEGKADQAGTDIGGIESSISTINSTLTSINNAVSQLRLDTNANTGAIHTIQELIGNGTPTTTDKTLIGAINEINSDVSDIKTEVVDLNFTRTGSITWTWKTGVTYSNLAGEARYALNDDGSIGKIYGTLSMSGFSIPLTGSDFNDIADSNISVKAPGTGQGYYIDLGLVLYKTQSGIDNSYPLRLHIHDDGSVSLAMRAGSSVTFTGTTIWINMVAVLYFFESFGD